MSLQLGSLVTSAPMDTGESFTPGDLPEEPEGADEEPDGLLRGWLPPEDRLWRHPSEMAGEPARTGPMGSAGISDDDAGGSTRVRSHRTTVTVGVVGVATLAVAAAVVLSLLDAPGTTTVVRSASGNRVVATTSMTTLAFGHDVSALIAAVRPSLVRLEPVGRSGAELTTGVVLPGGDLVLTAASAVAGASQLEVVTADGRRRRGTVVGTDAQSGVAVVSTGGGMVPATFAEEDVQPDDLAIVACLCTRHAPPPGPPEADVGMVTQVGTGVALDGGPTLVNAIEAEWPLGPTSWGGVLLDGRGQVIGILDGQANDGGDTLGVFVPAPLAESVALELAQAHRIDHGWLGIVCSDQGTQGATVTAFLPGSPAAAAGIRVGDVLEDIDAHAVSSVADVQERLYTMAPGTTVYLTVRRGGDGTTLPVTLAPSPAN